MVLPIYVYGSPVLKKVAQDINKDYDGLEQLIVDMWDTMYYADGVGLAAPQIGKSIRLMVIDASAIAKDDERAKSFKKVMINPVITERTGDTVPYSEGCLSVPKLYEDVMRENKIKITYLDENFVEHHDEYEGILARVIQHEYDHLEGIVFVDRLSQLRKKMIQSKLAAMTKGKVNTSYRTKIG